ncbi:Phosphoglucosamine mutase [Giardia duodenalis]|uniref:Phosphoglucosamine mutase n=2 Tax=Giardia intestinalis TaxID=5741 RepID=E2RTN2_GIAIC|nr:Phosphoglucosamine mutase [Giardia intestinalis]AAK69601.1 phosphomannomutase [Giardia intestinalis]KAE8301666.1 Phosphoglucosamine mutase [Giardia intestinalis]|eukprot:XP_001707082.1 Phosphoacetylglucosamine mutase [Giardia lamblia ATCC 50803]
MDRLIATFSGLRWIHDEQSFGRIMCYVTAFAKALPQMVDNCSTTRSKKLVYVGRDGRNTGDEYPKYIIAALLLEGFNVKYLDIVPTPTVQQLVRNSQCAGGVIATASHNPPKWNGLKFVGPSSIFLTPDECTRVYSCVTEDMLQKEYHSFMTKHPHTVLVQEIADSIQNKKTYTHNKAKMEYVGSDDAIAEHIKHVLAQTPLVNAASIRESNFSIGFSGCNASGAMYIVSLCEHLGVSLKVPYMMEPGPLPLQPEPIPENLVQFGQAIKDQGDVHVGFAVDPDADRLVILTETGVPLGEDYTLALCVDYALSLQPPGEYHIVTNISTSLVVADACRKHEERGVKGVLHYTAVGEVNVALKMLELGDRCLVGGEGNGGVMLPSAHIGRDSIVAIVLVLSWLAKMRKLHGERPISELVAERFQKYYIKKNKYTIAPEKRAKLDKKLQALAQEASEYDVDTVDGVKFTSVSSRKWVHMRFSNTEPIIRIISEAPSEDEAVELIKNYEKALSLIT